MADNLLKQYQQQARDEAAQDGNEVAGDDDDAGIDDENSKNALENKVLEEFINEQHAKVAKISSEYKLFDVVTAKQPSQVLRYSQQQSALRNPLWVSDRHKPAEVPACAKCGSQRIFEFQLTPQFLNYQELLTLVDWDTIAVYSCTSTKCMPDLANGEFFLPEFAFIQFSEDFDKVQYGTKEEIALRKQQRAKQQAVAEGTDLLNEDEKARIEELKAQEEQIAKKKADKNRKRKEKKK